MMINSNTMVSITDANQNFSRVARMVDERGSAVIMKNNMPRYLIVDFKQVDQLLPSDDVDVMKISAQLISQNREAYEELAK